MASESTLPTPIPPVSFAQLDAARTHSFRVDQKPAIKAAAHNAHIAHLQVEAAKAPIFGYASSVAAPPVTPHAVKTSGWLWFPATLIAGFLLYTFFSKSAAEKSAKRRAAGKAAADKFLGKS